MCTSSDIPSSLSATFNSVIFAFETPPSGSTSTVSESLRPLAAAKRAKTFV